MATTKGPGAPAPPPRVGPWMYSTPDAFKSDSAVLWGRKERVRLGLTSREAQRLAPPPAPQPAPSAQGAAPPPPAAAPPFGAGMAGDLAPPIPPAPPAPAAPAAPTFGAGAPDLHGEARSFGDQWRQSLGMGGGDLQAQAMAAAPAPLAPPPPILPGPAPSPLTPPPLPSAVAQQQPPPLLPPPTPPVAAATPASAAATPASATVGAFGPSPTSPASAPFGTSAPAPMSLPAPLPPAPSLAPPALSRAPVQPAPTELPSPILPLYQAPPPSPHAATAPQPDTAPSEGSGRAADGSLAPNRQGYFPLVTDSTRSDITDHGTHEGGPAADVFAPLGSPIYAPTGGTVTAATYSKGGNTATLHGDDGRYYYMAHGNVPFAAGRVEGGQQIGEVGDSGNAAGGPTHVHFAITDDGDFARGVNGGSGNIWPTTDLWATAAQAANAVANPLAAAVGGALGTGQPPANPAAAMRQADTGDIRGFVRQTAAKYGIDPSTAEAVVGSEGGFDTWNRQSDYVNPHTGEREQSYGPLQLYMTGGLGNAFQQETGLDPRDAANGPAATDWALRYASQHGWGDWHGAQRIGLDNFAGIAGNAGAPAQDFSPSTFGANQPASYGKLGMQAPLPQQTVPAETPDQQAMRWLEQARSGAAGVGTDILGAIGSGVSAVGGAVGSVLPGPVERAAQSAWETAGGAPATVAGWLQPAVDAAPTLAPAAAAALVPAAPGQAIAGLPALVEQARHALPATPSLPSLPNLGQVAPAVAASLGAAAPGVAASGLGALLPPSPAGGTAPSSGLLEGAGQFAGRLLRGEGLRGYVAPSTAGFQPQFNLDVSRGGNRGKADPTGWQAAVSLFNNLADEGSRNAYAAAINGVDEALRYSPAATMAGAVHYVITGDSSALDNPTARVVQAIQQSSPAGAGLPLALAGMSSADRLVAPFVEAGLGKLAYAPTGAETISPEQARARFQRLPSAIQFALTSALSPVNIIPLGGAGHVAVPAGERAAQVVGEAYRNPRVAAAAEALMARGVAGGADVLGSARAGGLTATQVAHADVLGLPALTPALEVAQRGALARAKTAVRALAKARPTQVIGDKRLVLNLGLGQIGEDLAARLGIDRGRGGVPVADALLGHLGYDPQRRVFQNLLDIGFNHEVLATERRGLVGGVPELGVSIALPKGSTYADARAVAAYLGRYGLQDGIGILHPLSAPALGTLYRANPSAAELPLPNAATGTIGVAKALLVTKPDGAAWSAAETDALDAALGGGAIEASADGGQLLLIDYAHMGDEYLRAAARHMDAALDRLGLHADGTIAYTGHDFVRSEDYGAALSGYRPNRPGDWDAADSLGPSVLYGRSAAGGELALAEHARRGAAVRPAIDWRPTDVPVGPDLHTLAAVRRGYGAGPVRPPTLAGSVHPYADASVEALLGRPLPSAARQRAVMDAARSGDFRTALDAATRTGYFDYAAAEMAARAQAAAREVPYINPEFVHGVEKVPAPHSAIAPGYGRYLPNPNVPEGGAYLGRATRRGPLVVPAAGPQGHVTPETAEALWRFRTPLSPHRLARILGQWPDYLRNAEPFFREMRARVDREGFNRLDVAKSFVATLSSQQAGEMSLTGYLASRTRPKWMGREAFTARSLVDDSKSVLQLYGHERIDPKTGQPEWYIRPEAMAFVAYETPFGRKVLNDIANGTATDADLREFVNFRDPYGSNVLRNAGLPGAKSKAEFTLRNIQAATDALNAMRHDPHLLDQTFRRLSGIGIGKSPFIGSWLGHAELPTVDAREVNIHSAADLLGDPRLAERWAKRELWDDRAQSYRAGEIAYHASGQPDTLGTEVRNDIQRAFKDYTARTGVGEHLPESMYGGLMHWYLWDRSMGELTEHGGIAPAMLSDAFRLRPGGGAAAGGMTLDEPSRFGLPSLANDLGTRLPRITGGGAAAAGVQAPQDAAEQLAASFEAGPYSQQNALDVLRADSPRRIAANLRDTLRERAVALARGSRLSVADAEQFLGETYRALVERMPASLNTVSGIGGEQLAELVDRGRFSTKLLNPNMPTLAAVGRRSAEAVGVKRLEQLGKKAIKDGTWQGSLAEYVQARGEQFARDEATSLQMLTGAHPLPSRGGRRDPLATPSMYASDINSAPGFNDVHGVVHIFWGPEAQTLHTNHHAFALAAPGQDIHTANTPEGVQQAWRRYVQQSLDRGVEPTPVGFVTAGKPNVRMGGWQGVGLPVGGGRVVGRNDLVVHGDYKASSRAISLLQTLPTKGNEADLANLIRQGRVSPEQAAAVLLREGTSHAQPMQVAAKRLLKGMEARGKRPAPPEVLAEIADKLRRGKTLSPEDVEIRDTGRGVFLTPAEREATQLGYAPNVRRTEAMVLDPQPRQIGSLAFTGERQDLLKRVPASQAVSAETGHREGRALRSLLELMAEARQQAVADAAAQGRSIEPPPIYFMETTAAHAAVPTFQGEGGRIVPGTKRIEDAHVLDLTPDQARAITDPSQLDQYIVGRAGPAIAAGRPWIRETAAAIRDAGGGQPFHDIGARGVGTLAGATIGAAQPADTPEERLRHALLGGAAGAGLDVGAAVASRQLARHPALLGDLARGAGRALADVQVPRGLAVRAAPALAGGLFGGTAGAAQAAAEGQQPDETPEQFRARVLQDAAIGGLGFAAALGLGTAGVVGARRGLPALARAAGRLTPGRLHPPATVSGPQQARALISLDLLARPASAISNVLGSVFGTPLRAVEGALAEPNEWLVRRLTGMQTPKTRYGLREARWATERGALRGLLSRTFATLGSTYRTGESPAVQAARAAGQTIPDNELRAELGWGGPKWAPWNWLNYAVGRPQYAADEAAKALIGLDAVHVEAYRKGAAYGLTGAGLERFVESQAQKFVASNGTGRGLVPSVQKAVQRAQQYRTFQQEAGRIQRGLSAISRTPYIGPLIQPFSRGPWNITKMGLEHSPLGGVGILADVAKGRYRGGKEAGDLADRMARFEVGMGLAALTSAAYASGTVTGSGPEDPAAAQQWRDQGNVPFAWKTAVGWVPLSFFAPVGSGLIATVAALDAVAKHPDDVDTQTKVTHAIYGIEDALAGNNANLRTFSILGSLADAAQGQGGRPAEQALPHALVQTVAGQLRGLVPGSAALAAANQALDPTERVTNESVLGPAVAGIPFASRALPAKLDLAGQPLPRNLAALGTPTLQGVLESEFNPFRRTANRAPTIEREGARLGIANPRPPGQIGETALSPEQQRAYAGLSGQQAGAAVDALVQTPAYRDAPPTVQAELVRRAWDFARGQAQQDVAEQGDISTRQAGEPYRYDPQDLADVLRETLPPDHAEYLVAHPDALDAAITGAQRRVLLWRNGRRQSDPPPDADFILARLARVRAGDWRLWDREQRFGDRDQAMALAMALNPPGQAQPRQRVWLSPSE